MPDTKVTSIDIAYAAGVSQATVSRALRDSPAVSEATRKHVQAIAKEMNYSIDRAASNLRAKQTRTIAVLMCQDPGWGDASINPFFIAMLSSIMSRAASYKFDVLMSFQQLSEDWNADYQASHRADGIILLGHGDKDFRKKIATLVDQGSPFVSWGASLSDTSDEHVVACDNFQGGYILTKHLLKLGRKQFAFFGINSEDNPELLLRYTGHKQALVEHNQPAGEECFFNVDSLSEIAGYNAALRLLESGQEFDALFAASDLLAMGAIEALKDNGFRVPEDIAVVGFDDIPMAEHFTPALTTIKQDAAKAGELLVDNLIANINGAKSPSTLLPAPLIVRQSCGAHLAK